MIDKGFLVQLTNHLYGLTLLFPKKEPLRYKIRELADDVLADSVRIMSRGNPTGSIGLECQRALENLEVLDSFFSITKEQNWVSSDKVFTLQEDYIKLIEYLSSRIDSQIQSLKTEKPSLKNQESAFNPFPLEAEQEKEQEQEEKEQKETETEVKIEEKETEERELPEELQREKIIALSPPFSPEPEEEELPNIDEFIKESSNNKLNERQQTILEALKEKDKFQVWEIKKNFPETTKRTIRRDFKYLLNQGLIERIGEKNDTFYRLRGVGQTLIG